MLWFTKNYKEKKHYTLNPFDSDWTVVHIRKGKYKGVKYYYTWVKIQEEAGLCAKLSFGYKVVEGNKKFSIDRLTEDSTFNNIMGKILQNIIMGEAPSVEVRGINT